MTDVTRGVPCCEEVEVRPFSSLPWFLPSIRFGGVWNDYIAIHDFLDSSKGAMPDNRHRALTHNAWFIKEVIERVFGYVLMNSAGTEVSTRAVAEQHVMEDMHGAIPTAADYLSEMEYVSWMGGSDYAPSHRKLNRSRRTEFVPFLRRDGERPSVDPDSFLQE